MLTAVTINTKKALCHAAILGFAQRHSLPLNRIGDEHIRQSSTLAVAMEHLGRINDPDLREYAASRGGVGWKALVSNYPTQLEAAESFREALDLLPDELLSA